MADTMSSVYCTAPWNGLTIREDGHVRTCCNGAVSLGNLNHVPIQAIENSSELMSIRARMQQGQPDPENCQLCMQADAVSGVDSLRQYYLKNYPNTESLALRFIDVRWNNLCNLACQYCDSTFSSVWAERTGVNCIRPISNYQDALLEWIMSKITDVDEIMLVGGEPMLMKQNHQLLEKLPQSARISIITNLSYDLERLPCWPALLDRPRENIIWNVSLENTGSKFEYVRNGANWNQVVKNIKTLTWYWPTTVGLNMVYSMFNAFDIDQDLAEYHAMGVRKFNLFNILNNSAMNVFNMPRAIQTLARDHLEQAVQRHLELLHPDDRSLYPIQGVEEILTRLAQQSGAVTQVEFKNQIAQYNQWSQNRFETLWPRVCDLVKNHCKLHRDSV